MPQPNIPSPEKSKQETLSEYEKFFLGKGIRRLTKEEIKKLNKLSISYNPNRFQESVNIAIIDETANKQVMRLAVSFSYFMVELTVLNSL